MTTRSSSSRWKILGGLALALIVAVAINAAASRSFAADSPDPDSREAIGTVLQALSATPGVPELALEYVDQNWREGFAPMLVEMIYMARGPEERARLFQLLKRKTGKSLRDQAAFWEYLWKQQAEPHRYYADFKAALYALIDPKFRGYFSSERTTLIRLDEVRWGGVRQDGIPPLRGPKMIAASDASYLDDDNVVFGLEVEGDARAYPKRILAWHEMFVDTVGGVPVAGVYCTLCGSMILYETTHDGVNHELGTSGFLYRSNKLMYDKATQSLWNTLWGRPVIGPLANSDITLKRRSVVTSTWGEWLRRHPDTRVLSLDTGHDRDYSEGAAYRAYFATDKLMFGVPKLDRRLKNKDEVLALVSPDESAQLAISAKFLAKNPLYGDELGGEKFVILTDRSGANRAYVVGDARFESWDGDALAVDATGSRWMVHEDRLESDDGRTFPRLAAHRAFWFGWYAAYPETRLVK